MSNHFSLSQARTALACPKQYYYKYIEQVPQGEDNIAALCGKALDAGLTEWFINGGDKRAAALVVSEAMKGLLSQEWINEEVIRDLDAILDSPYGHYDLRRCQNPQVEIWAHVPGVGPPVLGYADLVDYGQGIVTDWKRGGGWDEAWWHAAEKQVSFYADSLGMTRGRVVQVKDGKVTAREFNLKIEVVAEVHDDLRAGWLFSKTGLAFSGKSCAWCPFTTICSDNVFDKLGGQGG